MTKNLPSDLESLSAQAISAYQAGNVAESERLCLAILQKDRASPVACNVLGVIRAKQRRSAEAFDLISVALQANPNAVDTLANYAIVLQQLRRFDEALRTYEHVLTLAPRNEGALWNRAHLLSDTRQFTEALAAYDAVLAVYPNHPNALYRRAAALRDMGRLEEALAAFDRLIAAKPDLTAAFCDRGTLLQRLNRSDEALACYDKALAIQPDDPLVLSNRGLLLSSLGRFDDALASYDRILAIKPDFVHAWVGRGNVLRYLGRPQDSLECYERALAVRPDDPEALCNRGISLASLDRLEDAVASFDRALMTAPKYPEGWNNRGTVMWRLGRFANSLANHDRAVAIDPSYVEAHFNRAIVLRSLGRHEDAVRAYDAVIARKPDHAKAWANRGVELSDLARTGDALASYSRAIEIDPDNLNALFSRGMLAWIKNQNYDGAVRDFERLVALQPDYKFAAGELLHLRTQGGDWRDFEKELALIDDGVRNGHAVISPYCYQALSDSPSDLQACAVLFAEEYYPPRPPVQARMNRSGAKIRIGYLSGEFFEQATAFLAVGLYECHDKSKFEIVAVDNGPTDNGPTRKRLEAAFDKFVGIKGLSDEAAARAIAAEDIDILVNLNGYFGQARTGAFAFKPAPIQVNYLGFPGTMGVSYMDYIVADRIVIPEGDRRFYTESVVYLPGSYQVNDAKRPIAAEMPSRAECGLPGDGFVFCNFNQTYKILPATFALWMRILRAVEGSVLWMIEHTPAVTANLRREAEKHGVSGERLVFAPYTSLPKHLARLKCADLLLDSLPYNAHTTASDALWAGVPILACRGNAFAGRVAASLLHAAGLPELVADTPAGFEARALELARDPAQLKSLRRKLDENRLTCALFDTDRFRRHIEAAYMMMVERWERGDAPASFTVEGR